MELEVREVTGEEKARLNNRLKAYKNEMQRFEQDLVSSQIKKYMFMAWVGAPLKLAFCGLLLSPAILISRLLLCMLRMYVASIRLDFH